MSTLEWLMTLTVIALIFSLIRDNWGKNSTRRLLEKYWKLNDGMELINANRAHSFTGPSQWPQYSSMFKQIQVFRISVKDSGGEKRDGWLRLELVGFFPHTANTDVVWDNESVPLFSDKSRSNYIYFVSTTVFTLLLAIVLIILSEYDNFRFFFGCLILFCISLALMIILGIITKRQEKIR